MHLFPILSLSSLATANVINLPFQSHTHHLRDAFSDLHKRVQQNSTDRSFQNYTIPLTMNGTGYYTTIGVGTPPQDLYFLLDTTNSYTWVLEDENIPIEAPDIPPVDTQPHTGCKSTFKHSYMTWQKTMQINQC